MSSVDSSELRSGFENESTDQVLASLKRLVETTARHTPITIAIGHQRYLDLDIRVKKNSTEDPPLWNLLNEVPVTTLETLQRVDFHFEFQITSVKEEAKYDKEKQRLQKLVAKLAQRLQKKIEDGDENEEKHISVDGNSQRVEEPHQTVVAGCVSILISTMPADGHGGDG